MTSAAPRVLLTGATGFLGAQVLDELAGRALEVHALSRNPPLPESRPGVRWYRVDLLANDDEGRALPDLAAIGASHCLHLAWEATPGRYRDAPENRAWVPASLRLARAFFAAGGTSFVFAGSCAEYGIPAEVCDELRSPLVPDCAYAAGKIAAERELAALAQAAGARFATGRIFFPYGPGGPRGRVVTNICRSLARGEPIALSSGDDVLDYMYHTDVTRAFSALALSNVGGPVNIGSGTGISIRELATRLGALAGGAKLLHFGEVRFARPTVRIVAATARLGSEVGYRPVVTLDTGLRASFEAARS